MACKICKRGSCTESFHSLEEQIAFDEGKPWPPEEEDTQEENCDEGDDN